MNLFLKLLPLLLPLIDHLVDGVEVLFSGRKGSEKKAAVMNVVQAATPLLQATVKQEVPWDQVSMGVSGLIDLSVAAAKAMGRFQAQQGLTQDETAT